MVLKLNSRIVDYGIVDNDNEPGAGSDGETQATFLPPPTEAETVQAEARAEQASPRVDPQQLEQMHEAIERQEIMFGATYKMTPPVLDHALYVTINDITLNAGTTHEIRRPYEIFINTKNLQHLEWMVALTRVISAVFRKGGAIEFLIEELKSVYSPSGGYFKPNSGGKHMNSVVSELGHIIEEHLILIGLVAPTRPAQHQQELIDAKRRQLASGQSAFSGKGQYCPKCFEHAVVMSEGCLTCLNCGDSKCG